MTTIHPQRGDSGIVEIAIQATETRMTIDGREVRVLAYNGELPGPTFYVSEGDRVRIVFTNGLSEPSNLHLHGMPMPPEVDDPHRVAAPGESLTYEFEVPAGAAGIYWYHPHVHGEVAWQLGAGLAGAFVVTGPDDAQAPLAAATEEVLVLQDLSLDDAGVRARTVMEMHDGREGELVLVNGRRTPGFAVVTGLMRLRLVNASTARFYDVVLDGAPMHLIGLDASLLEQPVGIDHILLPPGQRADVLIDAGSAGSLTLRQRPYRRGVFRAPWSRRRLPDDGVLATFAITGPDRRVRMPQLSRAIESLDPSDAVATRIFEYGGTGSALRMVFELARGTTYGPGDGARGPVRFWLNGREFEPGRIDVEARLGTVEIWELRNPTPLDHPFHLHIYPFQVLDIDGVAPAMRAWQDVVNVPSKSIVRILVPFRGFTGITMFHCHIVEHEDNGMMGHLRVVDPAMPGDAAPAHWSPDPAS